MKIKIVTNHHRLVAMRAENNIADHEAAHRFHMGFVALKTSDRDTP